MKKLSLNQTWILCLRMWRWIAKEWKKGDDVTHLKTLWVRKNGYEVEIRANCFFCEYDYKFWPEGYSACSHCPGRLIDSNFLCGRLAATYHYDKYPIAFYAELLRLNRIRKGKK